MARRAVNHLLIVIYALLVAATTAAGRTGYVSQGGAQANTTTLVEALKDQTITTIVLTTDYDVGHEFDGNLSPRSPIPVNRNVTITGLPGQAMPLWNLRFQRASVELCAGCAFTLDSIAIANERRGNGAAVDLFVGAQGSPGAVVATRHLFRLRPACTSTASTLELITKDQPRSKRFPLAQPPQRQMLDVVNASFRGVDYSNMLMLADYAYDVPLTYQEALGSVGGYTLSVRNTTRLCAHILTGSCLLVKSPDACVNDLIDQLLAQEGQARQHSLLAPVVGAVVAAVVVAAAVAGLLLWRRQRRRRAAAGQVPPGSKGSSDLEKGTTSSGAEPGGEPGQVLAEPLLDTAGWDVTGCSTTPSLALLDDTRITLGMMIGAGSFGRVYKGRWGGRDVAVKVIEHESASAVENEVQLMLSISHTNVVRAYHYITYTSKAAPPEPSLSSGAAARQAGTKALSQQTAAATASEALPSSSAPGSKSSLSSSSLAQACTAPSQQGRAPAEPGDAASQAAAAKLSALKHVLRLGEQQQQPQRVPAAHSDQDSSLGQEPLGQSSSSDMSHAADQATQQQQRLIQQHASAIKPAAPASGQQQQQQAAPPPDAYAAAAGPTGTSWALDTWPSPPASGPAAGCQPGLESPAQAQRTPGGSLSAVLRSRTWLVQEFCDCGTLSSWVGNTLMDPADTQQVLHLLLLLQDAARGVHHLHSKSIVHGDLNARNVLVRSSASGGVVAKLADLGISRVIKQHSTHRTTNTVGTMSHMPPELLRYGRMSPAVDVYAFGVMMWELYTGQIAFKKLQYGQFFEHVVLRNSRPPLPPLMPEDYSLLLTSCWAIEPSERPSIAAVLDCLKLMITERQLHGSGEQQQQL
uniref:Protein kinase domain-containing protein n=1 Tax=Tetradesmus obliquus TaxID=3088 RepID=A0A383WBA4_TETOB|eukprot:jgi/Sobl393_1/2842/SZX73976.1